MTRLLLPSGAAHRTTVFRILCCCCSVLVVAGTTQRTPYAFVPATNTGGFSSTIRPNSAPVGPSQQHQQQHARSPVFTLKVIMADAEMEELHKERKKKNDWIETSNGGFLPSLKNRMRIRSSSTTRKPETIQQIATLGDYKKVVVDEPDKITVVRFFAPWCRACKAMEPKYKKLAATYADCDDVVQFVEVPLTKDTAVLQEGLGVPSLPYGHIYHPTVGLTEELKINKNEFAKFQQILQTYVQGYCPVTYDSGDHDELPPLQ